MRDLCPDRPAKGSAPCTLDKGHLQIEADLIDVTRDSQAGMRTTTSLVASPTLKWGVGDNLDVEATWSPYARVSTSGPGVHDRATGVGDLYLRAKANLTGNRNEGVNLAIAPFVKAPTAKSGIGDGAWEQGVLAMAAGDGPGGWSWDATVEADRLHDEAGGGWHGAGSLAFGLTHALGPLSATAEVWTQVDWEPTGTERQASADLALAWIPQRQPTLQLDAGVNLGLNRQTPDVQAYLGVTRRF